MRELTTHKGTLENDAVRIFPEDDPLPDGSPWHYRLLFQAPGLSEWGGEQHLRFVRPGKEGHTDAELLAIVIDRLESRNGKSREHGFALTDLQSALAWLNGRSPAGDAILIPAESKELAALKSKKQQKKKPKPRAKR